MGSMSPSDISVHQFQVPATPEKPELISGRRIPHLLLRQLLSASHTFAGRPLSNKTHLCSEFSTSRSPNCSATGVLAAGSPYF